MERSQWYATFGLCRYGGDLGGVPNWMRLSALVGMVATSEAFQMSCDFRALSVWWRPWRRSKLDATFGFCRHGGDLGAFPMSCDFRPLSVWGRPRSVRNGLRLSAFVGMGATSERSQLDATFGLGSHGGDLGAFPMVCDFRPLSVWGRPWSVRNWMRLSAFGGRE